MQSWIKGDHAIMSQCFLLIQMAILRYLSDKGKITCLSNNLSEKQVIFDVSHSSDSLPSQLALAIDNEQRLILSFAAGNTAFMILNDGTFVNKFPQRLSDFTVKEKSFVTVLQKDNDLISVFNAVNDGFRIIIVV